VSVASVLVSGASCQFPHSYAAARALMEPVIIMIVTELKSLKALQARMELLSARMELLSARMELLSARMELLSARMELLSSSYDALVKLL